MAQAALKPREEEQPPYVEAGATLLSKQPSNIAIKDQKDQKGWATLRGHLEQRLVSLRNWRTSWWNTNWSDLAQFILPRRSIWLTQSTGGNPSANNNTRGREINGSIADPTATLAVRVCTGGLVSGLASPSRPWFKMILAQRDAEPDEAGREWIDETEDRMYTVLAGSNFYDSFATECEDLVVFGTGPSIIYEDEKDVIRLYNPAVGEYYLASGATLRIDGLYRLFVMTVSQIVDFFKLENCPPEIQSLWKEKGASLDLERLIAHSIEPNYGIGEDNAGKIAGGFTWRETYWLHGMGSAKPCVLTGYIDQPFTAARWATQSNDAYGRSPGMDVLPDVMQLQVMTRRMAEAIEKQVRPPLIGDMSLKNQPSSTLPGHLTYVTDIGPSKGIRSIYNVEPDINAMAANILAIEKRIQVGFFNDLFLMLEQVQTGKMTAYEVAAKVNEKMQVIGPVIESLLAESLKPKLKRIYGIMRRKGLISDPPDSLKGVTLDIQFVSMLALAQKAAATGGIERLVALVGSMETLFPTARDKVDSDELIDEMNELLGNPSKIIRGKDAVAAYRAQQAAAAERQQQLDQFSQVAEAAGKAAPAAQVLAGLSPPGSGTLGPGGATP